MEILSYLIAFSLLGVSTLAAQAPEGIDALDPLTQAPATYKTMRVEDLPRDEQGFLTSAVWDIIKAEATAHPGSNESRILEERPVYQAYYETYAGWTAPPPLPVADGRLRNLSEPPTAPRFPIADKVWPAKPGEASVCLWEDDKLAAMSLGVDDNCAMDLPFWKELSERYGGLNITWNLIVGNIEGGITGGRLAMSGKWETWQRLLDEGYRVASHSMTHHHAPVPSDGWPGPDWEAAESKRLIESHLPGYRTRTYAYAGSGVRAFGQPRNLIKSAWRPALSKYYIGARGAGRNVLNQANLIDYFNINASGAVQYFLDSKDPRYADQDLNNLFAADPGHPYHKYYRGWANVFSHFLNEGKEWETNPGYIAYAKVLDFYNRNREELWNGFFDDIVLYGQERDTATITVDETTDKKIAFTLVTKMEPTIFDYPLTIKVRLPDAWKALSAKQNGTGLPVQFLTHEGAPYALVKVVPDRGQVILEATDASAP